MRKGARAMPQASRYTGRNRILAALPPEDFDRFSPALQPIFLSLRQVIHDVSSPIEHVYFVEQGVGSILTIMADGSAIEVGMIGSEGMLGVSAVFGSATSDQRVIVQIPGTALRMDAARCKAAFDESAAVRMAVLRFATGLMNLSARIATASKRPPANATGSIMSVLSGHRRINIWDLIRRLGFRHMPHKLHWTKPLRGREPHQREGGR